MNKMQINKRSPFVAGVIGVVFAVLAAAGLCTKLQAAININSLQTFNSLPSVADWSSLSVAGGGGAPVAIADLDILVQTNTASSINTVLSTSTLAAPAQVVQAIWTSGAGNGGLLVTRATGNAATILMATITNSTGANFPSPVVSYDFSLPSPLNSEDAGTAGHIVYYSLTGLADSWVKIAELTSAQPTPVPGSLVATLSLGSWPAGSLLYIIWVDDNGNGATDGSFAIDNFLVSANIACPEILSQPSNTNNLVGRTVRLSVQAQGPGLNYQWNKVGVGPLDIIANPSAATATLTITNAQVSDTGDYNLTIANGCGSVTSANAHIGISADTIPPVFVLASVVGPGLNTFRLITDEELCNDPGSCGTDATSPFNWHIYLSGSRELIDDLGVSSVTKINATTYEFATSFSRDSSAQYDITVDEFGEVGDIYGIQVAPGTFATTGLELAFQQGDANGYTGTQDAGIHSGTPDTTEGSDAIINTDSDDGGIRQALLRFDNIFGVGVGRIPPGAVVTSATLTLNQTDPGNVVNFHRMLASWDQSTVTWNSLVGGLDLNNVEVATVADAATVGTGQANGLLTLDVTATVRAWAGGAANYGWAILPTGGDGWRWNSSESGVSTAPLLSVQYSVGVCTTAPTITAQPPANTAVNERSSFSLSAGVDICGNAAFQWTKDGTDILGANGVTYAVANATAGAGGSGGTYRLRASNQFGSVTSDPAIVTVIPDTTGPRVARVVNGSDGVTITVAFNEPVSTASAQNTANYTLTPSVAVSGAVLGANNTVTLTTGARTPGAAYSLRIAGVTDTALAANVLNPNPTVVNLTAGTPVASAGWGDAWLYNTNNLDGTPTWKDAAFVPGEDWLNGNGLFGTETSAGIVALFPVPIATVIPANDVAPGDFTAVHFRKSVTLPALSGGAIYILEHFIDDGAVFYWDGVEFGRFNMTNGPVVYSTRAATANEGSRQALRLPASASTGGTHTLAVEVHQGGATTSSDIVFGAEILAVGPLPSLSISHSDGANTVSWTGDSSWRLVRSAVVNGPYTAVAGNPFHTFVVPPAANTNSAFFMLEFNPAP